MTGCAAANEARREVCVSIPGGAVIVLEGESNLYTVSMVFVRPNMKKQQNSSSM